MSATLPPLRGSATIDTGPAEASLGKLKAAASGFGKELKNSLERDGGASFSSLSKSAEAFGGIANVALKGAAYGAAALGVAMAATTAAFVAANRSLLEYSDRIVTMHQRTRLSTDTLQVLSHMAKVSGTDLGTLGRAVTLMSVNISKGDDAFKKLGLSLSDLKKSSPDEAFAKVSTAIGGLADPMQQSAAAMEIFGRSGAQLLPVFATDMSKAREEAERMGLVLNSETLFASEALGDAIDTSTAALVKFGERLAGVVQQNPSAIMAVESIGEAFGALSKLLDDNAATIQKWANIAALAMTELAASAATLAGLAVSVGKAGMFGWAVELSGIEKLTDGLKKYTQEAQDAVLARIKWAAIDMGGKGVLLPGGVLPKQGVTGGAFDASDAMEKQARATEKLREAEKKLFDQRSAALAKSATPIGGFGFWNDNETNKRYEINTMAAGDPRKVYNLFGDRSKFMPQEMEGGAHLSHDPAEKARLAEIAQAKAAETAARWAGALQGVALMAGAVGGKLGATIGAMENIGRSFENWSSMNKNEKFNAIAGGVGQIGGLIGGSAGAGIQGGAGGAMLGNSLAGALKIAGPWGAIAGGAIGLIGGLFGNKAKEKKELAEMKGQLEGLRETAKGLGVDLTKAFASKNINEVKAAIEAVNKAAADKEKRLAGVATFTGGMNQWAQGGGISDQASADRAGRFAMFSFGNQVKESGDIFGALESIGPTLEAMAKSAKEFGLEMPKGIESLLQLNNLDEGIKSQVSGLNAMTKGIGESGMMTKSLFADLGAEAVATRAKLAETGLSGAQSMAIMQPSLQQLYEAQKLHGYAVDETTQALLDEAKAQGVVGDQFMSANERMVELLGILVEAVGGKLPDSYRRAGDAAEEYGRRARSSLPPAPGGPGDPVEEPQETGGRPGFASGTAFRNFGSGTAVMLHGEEAVMTRPQVDRLVGMAVSGSAPAAAGWGGGSGGGGGTGGKIVIELGGQRVGEALYTMSRKGQLKIDQKAVTRR